MEAGFFPLDEELGLFAGGLSPSTEEGLTRLGAWMPFKSAAKLLDFFWKIPVSTSTARRHVEAAGAAYVAVQTAEVEVLEREVVPATVGPALQQVSVDGAFVPLVGGVWGEVKTIAIGTVLPRSRVATESDDGPRTGELSYFSRLADAEQFNRLALAELHQRGTETAGLVVAVNDGAEWIQGFFDLHRPDAVRVLDFPHAVEQVRFAGYLGSAAQATFGPGTAATSEWLGVQAHELKHGDPDRVLAAVRALPTARAHDSAQAVAARDKSLGYLQKRRDQLCYAQFRALGYPIGSGAVESANKLVVEVRLKGSGMHWSPANVNAMLALRNIACSDRWETGWPQIVDQRLADQRRRRSIRRDARLATRSAALAGVTSVGPTAVLAAASTPAVVEPRPKLVVDGRPTSAHPWRRPFLANRHTHVGSRAKQ